jgi:small subunit ribosomal protein S18
MEAEVSTDSQLVKNVSPLELKYTDVEKLSTVITGTGKILARKFTGLTAHQQRHVTRMIKRARNMLLMK